MPSQSTVTWGEIIAQCGNYRDGFVAIFRQYEGQPTDERDGSNRVIKVTAQSFAEHVGVHPDTFRRWIKATEVTSSALPTSRSVNDLTRDVTRAVRHAPEAVIEAIMAAPTRTQDRIFDEVNLRRAGIDTSLPNRKAAQAWASEMTEPIKKALTIPAKLRCLLALEEARETYLEVRDAGEMDAEFEQKVRTAIDDIVIEMIAEANS